jgi:hypothetical protein
VRIETVPAGVAKPVVAASLVSLAAVLVACAPPDESPESTRDTTPATLSPITLVPDLDQPPVEWSEVGRRPKITLSASRGIDKTGLRAKRGECIAEPG